MSLLSKIEWTDATWNPVRGCTKISPGLQALLRRDICRAVPRRQGASVRAGFDLRLVPEKLAEPSAVERAENDFRQFDERPVSARTCLYRIYRVVVATMRLARWHTYQVLTKRSDVFGKC